ncbi:Leucyl aminopeptidase yscIV, partial [Coemansia sp. RSA 2336]
MLADSDPPAFPVPVRLAAASINQVHTDVAVLGFSNCVVVLVTQLASVASLIRTTVSLLSDPAAFPAAEDAAPHSISDQLSAAADVPVDIKFILGNPAGSATSSLYQILATTISQRKHQQAPDDPRPLILGVGLKLPRECSLSLSADDSPADISTFSSTINAPSMQPSIIDKCSLSNLDQVTTEHIHLDLDVNFDAAHISGCVTISGKTLENGVSTVVLDTQSLNIVSVQLKKDGHFVDAVWKLEDAHPVYGQPLSIALESAQESCSFCLKVEYVTTQQGNAIQFLTPEQTLGKAHPYLFTQCQPILARSLLPCQDSPSVKLSYSADIRVPKPLTALMSAIATGSRDDGDSTVYSFEQKTTIPSYLIALVVGNLVSARISDRCAVWSEPENIDACAWEFAEMEKILQTAEEVISPYLWGRYDLLVLPPSFPYGGMENPCLTFVTPTLLAGDRSLTDVIAHEIAHSWSGNLVTAKNWEHFWLNEGWTTFFERKIVGRLNGEDARQLSCVIGYNNLRADVTRIGADSPLTALVPDLTGIDPDDSYSRIPYEKGSLLLYHLEQVLDPVILKHISKMYVLEFQGRSIGTGDFYDFVKHYVHHYLDENAEKRVNAIAWDAWFKSPGMPPVSFSFDEQPQKAAIELADRWWAAKDTLDPSKSFSKDEFA